MTNYDRRQSLDAFNRSGGTAIGPDRRMNAAGVHVALLVPFPEHKTAFGAEGSTPIRKCNLAPGLGLTNRVVVDQHFRQRDRPVD